MVNTTITGLPAKTPTGAEYIAIEDGTSTGKATLNAAVAATEAVASLNGNLTWQSVTLTAGSGVTINSSTAYKTGNFLVLYAYVTLTSQVSAYGTILTHGQNTKMSWIAPLYTPSKVPNTSYGVYADATNQTVRASINTPAGNYQIFCVIPIA